MSSVFETPGKLPSLAALRAFEATARLGSVARASDELCVTPGAVSHQIKGLEEQLGFVLFVRQGRGLKLTQDGHRLALSVNRMLVDVSNELLAIQRQYAHTRLAISVLPSFASRWLTARLGKFIEQYPDVELVLHSSRQWDDLRADGLDLAIRLGSGEWPGVDAEHWLDEYCVVVVSPDFSGGIPQSPAELKDKPLLRSDTEPWRPWFESVGLDWQEPVQGLLFSDSSLLVQAAVEGHGIGLARLSLVRDELASGKLIQLFASKLKLDCAYWLVKPSAAPQRPIVQAFMDWLKQEMQLLQDALPQRR